MGSSADDRHIARRNLVRTVSTWHQLLYPTTADDAIRSVRRRRKKTSTCRSRVPCVVAAKITTRRREEGPRHGAGEGGPGVRTPTPAMARTTCEIRLNPMTCFRGKGGSVADWLACWTQAQKARVQIAVATLSGNSLRQTVHTHCASVQPAAKLVAALAESNGSLPSGL